MLKTLLYLLPAAMVLAQTPPPKPAAPPTQSAPSKPALAPIPAPAKEAPAVVVAADAVVLTVGDEKMTRAQFEELIAGLPEQLREQANGPAKRQLAEQIVELKALAQEARRRKMDQTPVMRQQIAVQVDRTLATGLYQEVLASIKVDDAALKAAYEKNKGQYEQVKAAHILIRFQGSRVPLKPNQKDFTEDEALAKAQELVKKLRAGEDFAAVAKAESDDAGSGAQGGDLGNFSRGQMIGPFEEAAFSLEIGKVGDPVKTPFGYHIIKVSGHTSKTFEDARPELEKQIKPEQAKQAVDVLKKKTTVTLDDNYFGAAR